MTDNSLVVAVTAVKDTALTVADSSVVHDVPASIHPGLSDEELIAILAVAATEAMGQPVTVVRFRRMDSMDWTWSVQGRVGQHNSHKL